MVEELDTQAAMMLEMILKEALNPKERADTSREVRKMDMKTV